MVPLFRILAGISLLTLGRKLFWLFVAAIGFEIGASIAARFLSREPEWLVLAIAIAVGLLGALLALFVQNVVISAAGFMAGGFLLVSLLEVYGLEFGLLTFVVFVIGGIIGAALVAFLFDWALVVLSSLVGAITIVSVVLPPRTAPLATIAIAVVSAVGIAIQIALWQGERKRA